MLKIVAGESLSWPGADPGFLVGGREKAGGPGGR